jgi:hypothetical protein
MSPFRKSRFHISQCCIPETAFPYPQANVRYAHDSLFATAPWLYSFFHPFANLGQTGMKIQGHVNGRKCFVFQRPPTLEFSPGLTQLLLKLKKWNALFNPIVTLFYL